MARRKYVKRIDPRYFLHETVNRNNDGNRLDEAEGETPQDVAQRILNLPAMFRQSVLGDIRNMAKGDREHHSYYPHVQDHVAFATEVLQLVGEG